jgi:peptide/nickel transport system permease protein
MSKFSVRNLIRGCFFIFFLVGMIVFQAPNYVNLEQANLSALQNWHHPFGCDRLGRDNWAMFSYGTFTTVLICIPARIFTLFFASSFAFLSYFQKGRFSLFTDLLSSVFLALPSLLVALVAIAILPDSQWTIVIAIVFADWALSYETLQGKLREIKKSGFVSASISLGASSGHVFYFHLIPALRIILEFLFLTGIPSVIMTIALFSYLGINTNLLDFGPGLGEQISFSKDYFNKTPVSVLLPILCVIGLVYSFGRDDK